MKTLTFPVPYTPGDMGTRYVFELAIANDGFIGISLDKKFETELSCTANSKIRIEVDFCTQNTKVQSCLQAFENEDVELLSRAIEPPQIITFEGLTADIIRCHQQKFFVDDTFW